jgi:hypothetical protein
MTIFGKKPVELMLKEMFEPPTIPSLVRRMADLMISLSVMPVRILNASSTETPAASNVDVVLQNVATNPWLSMFPNKGMARVILLKKWWPFLVLEAAFARKIRTITPMIMYRIL